MEMGLHAEPLLDMPRTCHTIDATAAWRPIDSQTRGNGARTRTHGTTCRDTWQPILRQHHHATHGFNSRGPVGGKEAMTILTPAV